MNTERIVVDPVNPDSRSIARAAVLIQRGELVAFPTETVYGLGGNGLDASVAALIYEAKGRPSDNPLILHISDFEQIDGLVASRPSAFETLTKRFWPGPLAIVLKKHPRVPSRTSGALDTVAVRMPDHPVALALIKACGVPLAAPSANLSGKPSPTTADHVFEDLQGRIAAVLDGGPTRIGLESTVVDLTGPVPVVLRQGGVSIEALREVVPEFQQSEGTGLERSPGTRYRHYAPKATVVLVEDRTEARSKAYGLLRAGHKVVWVGSEEVEGISHRSFPDDAAYYAHHYFAALRELDAQAYAYIFVEPVAETGLGAAVMDRIRRSAGYGNAASSD